MLLFQIFQAVCISAVAYIVFLNSTAIIHDSNTITSIVTTVKDTFIADSKIITSAVIEVKEKIINDGADIVKDVNKITGVISEVGPCVKKFCG